MCWYNEAMKSTKSIPERFFAKVTKTDGCWLWTGSADDDGYGDFRIGRKELREKAHRWSYRFYKGTIPEGQMVLHTCDNPPCVNPDHLYSGNALNNATDCIQRNRKPRGAFWKRSNLTDEAVVQLRDMYRDGIEIREIAKVFSVSHGLISSIAVGKKWKHVPGICEPRGRLGWAPARAAKLRRKREA